MFKCLSGYNYINQSGEYMELSIVIPTYNRSKILLRTLQTINSQICDFDFEVIVCDDGSNDQTTDVVTSYVQQANFNLRYMRHGRSDARYSTVRNMGINNAIGRVVVLLDDDMLLPPTFLKAHFETHYQSNIVTIGYRYNLSPSQPESYELDTREKYFASYPKTEVPVWTIMETCNVSIERDLLVQAGMFDDAFRGWGGEDIELAYRLQKFGAILVLNREIFAWHQFDPDPKNSFYRYYRGLKPDFSSQISNLERFKRKYPEDQQLQELLTDWILRLQITQSDMLKHDFSC